MEVIENISVRYAWAFFTMGVKYSSFGKSNRSALSLYFLICLRFFFLFLCYEERFLKKFFWEMYTISSSSLTVSFVSVPLSTQYYWTWFRWWFTILVCIYKPIIFCCRLNEMLLCAWRQNRNVSFLSVRQKKKSASLILQKTFEAEFTAMVIWL